MTCFDKSKPMPKWMQRGHECASYERGKRYYRKIWQAQPAWADVDAIRRVYREAARRRRDGEDVHVDHIFPLCGESLCGLHIASNLQIIDSVKNVRKSNCEWPGREQLDFWEPEFFELETQ